jgi:hypothetical protein
MVLAFPVVVVAGGKVLFPEQWGCVLGAVSVKHVDVPPDDAPPDVVVRAYLEALDTHDGATVKELYPGHGSGCTVRSLDDIHVTPIVLGTHSETGTVRVVAQYRQQAFDEARAGETNGPMSRDFYLRKDGSGPWRIVDSGQG